MKTEGPALWELRSERECLLKTVRASSPSVVTRSFEVFQPKNDFRAACASLQMVQTASSFVAVGPTRPGM